MRRHLASARRRTGRRRATPQPQRGRAAGSFYLTRMEGGTATFLYDWDERQSVWGPERSKAFRFPSAPKAMDLAVVCGGPEGASQITIAED